MSNELIVVVVGITGTAFLSWIGWVSWHISTLSTRLFKLENNNDASDLKDEFSRVEDRLNKTLTAFELRLDQTNTRMTVLAGTYIDELRSILKDLKLRKD